MDITEISLDDASAIYTIVQQAINSNDMESIKSLFLCEDFRGISKVDREAYAFASAYHIYDKSNDDTAIKYLIYDYNMDESLCTQSIALDRNKMNKEVKKMFELRGLKDRLNNELIPLNQSNKRPKI